MLYLGSSSAITQTLQNAVAANGNGTTFDVNGNSTAIINITGTFSATINFEISDDDTNWVSVYALKMDTLVLSTTTTGTGIFRIAVGAVKSLRARISGYASGSVTVKGRAVAIDTPQFIVRVENSGAFPVQVDGNALTSLQLMDDVVFTDDAAFTPGTSKVNSIGLIADETSTDSIDEGDIGAARMTLDRKQITTNYSHTTGGWTPYKLISAASTNATSLKGSAGQIGFIIVGNKNAAERYLKIYNKASAPTVGTDTPVQVYMMPGNTAGTGFVLPPVPGIDLITGIAFALTTGIADSDTGAVAANEIVINIGYK